MVGSTPTSPTILIMQINFLNETAEIIEEQVKREGWIRNHHIWGRDSRFYSVWKIADPEGEIRKYSAGEAKHEWKSRVQKRARIAKFERKAIHLVGFYFHNSEIAIGEPFKAFAVSMPKGTLSAGKGYCIYNVDGQSDIHDPNCEPRYLFVSLADEIKSGNHKIHVVDRGAENKPVAVALWSQELFDSIKEVSKKARKFKFRHYAVDGKDADIIIKASQSEQPVLALAQSILGIE